MLTQSCVSLTSDCSKSATPHQPVGVSAVAGNESVFLSLTPTAPQVVFSVKRQLKMQPTSVDALVASLQKKYGPESLNSATPGNPLGSAAGIVNYVWLFDLQGHLAAGDQAVPFVDCANIANVAANSAGSLGAENAAISFDMQSHNSIAANSGNDPYPYPGSNHCVAVTTVTALMQVDKNGMASTLAVEIASFPLLYAAHSAWRGPNSISNSRLRLLSSRNLNRARRWRQQRRADLQFRRREPHNNLRDKAPARLTGARQSLRPARQPRLRGNLREGRPFRLVNQWRRAQSRLVTLPACRLQSMRPSCLMWWAFTSESEWTMQKRFFRNIIRRSPSLRRAQTA